MAQESGLYFQNKRNEPPHHFQSPEDLAQKMDLNLGHSGVKNKVIHKILEDIIFYTPHKAHPYYIFQVAASGI